MQCKHDLLENCCDDCIKEKLEVAELVYLALEGDGFYGPYTLGEDLWGRFEEAFKTD